MFKWAMMVTKDRFGHRPFDSPDHWDISHLKADNVVKMPIEAEITHSAFNEYEYGILV